MTQTAAWRRDTYGNRVLDREVAATLPNARAQHGWSVRTTRKVLAIAFGYVSLLENGECGSPHVVAERIVTSCSLSRAEGTMLRSVGLVGVG